MTDTAEEVLDPEPELRYLEGIDVEAGWLDTDDGQIAIGRTDFIFQDVNQERCKIRILVSLEDLSQIVEPLLMLGGWLVEMAEIGENTDG